MRGARPAVIRTSETHLRPEEGPTPTLNLKPVPGTQFVLPRAALCWALFPFFVTQQHQSNSWPPAHKRCRYLGRPWRDPAFFLCHRGWQQSMHSTVVCMPCRLMHVFAERYGTTFHVMAVWLTSASAAPLLGPDLTGQQGMLQPCCCRGHHSTVWYVPWGQKS